MDLMETLKQVETRNKIPWSQRENVQPGVMDEKGIYQDTEGIVHYPSGATMRPASKDKRLNNPSDPDSRLPAKHWKKEPATEEEIKANPFLALKPKEMQTLDLHLKGMSNADISLELGCAEQTVMLRMARGRVQRCLAIARKDHRNNLYNLLGEARQVLSEGLEETKPFHIRLACAKEIHKVTGQYDAAKEESNESGEDEMTRFIKNQVNVQVNVTNEKSG